MLCWKMQRRPLKITLNFSDEGGRFGDKLQHRGRDVVPSHKKGELKICSLQWRYLAEAQPKKHQKYMWFSISKTGKSHIHIMADKCPERLKHTTSTCKKVKYVFCLAKWPILPPPHCFKLVTILPQFFCLKRNEGAWTVGYSNSACKKVWKGKN